MNDEGNILIKGLLIDMWCERLVGSMSTRKGSPTIIASRLNASLLSEMKEEEIATKIHEEAIIIDALLYGPAADSDDYFEEVRRAGVTATNLTVPAVIDDFVQTKTKIDHWLCRIERNRDFMSLALSVQDIEQTKKEGKTAIVMGFQNAVHLEDRIENADEFKKLGVSIIQLTYQQKNSFGSGCGAALDSGLTEAGRELVERLNELGILIDLSHCGYQTTMDAIAASRQPCAFTHANVRALCDHPRNKTDEQIRALAKKGGVMGIASYSAFSDIKKNHSPTIAEYLDIIDYVVKLVGIDHVGMGLDLTPTWTREDYEEARKEYPEIYGDYEFGKQAVKGIDEISKIIDITRGLLSRGYEEEEIKKILGGNFLRLFAQVWD